MKLSVASRTHCPETKWEFVASECGYSHTHDFDKSSLVIGSCQDRRSTADRLYDADPMGQSQFGNLWCRNLGVEPINNGSHDNRKLICRGRERRDGAVCWAYDGLDAMLFECFVYPAPCDFLENGTSSINLFDWRIVLSGEVKRSWPDHSIPRLSTHTLNWRSPSVQLNLRAVVQLRVCIPIN